MSVLRPTSVRTRLALWYGLAVGIALVLYAGVVFAFFRASMLEQLGSRLHDDYEAAEHAFERAPDGGLRWTPRGTIRRPPPSRPRGSRSPGPGARRSSGGRPPRVPRTDPSSRASTRIAWATRTSSSVWGGPSGECARS